VNVQYWIDWIVGTVGTYFDPHMCLQTLPIVCPT